MATRGRTGGTACRRRSRSSTPASRCCSTTSQTMLTATFRVLSARRLRHETSQSTGLGEDAFFRLDYAEALDDVERPVVRLGDVHVQAQVVLARHHLGRTARSVRDGGVVERLYDRVLVERAGLVDGVFPELQAAVHAGACAARG